MQMLFDSNNCEEKTGQRRGSGPPNRMNDLPYKEWMKFQKSFFRYKSDHILVADAIHFFTKATWPNGKNSRSLIIGFEKFDAKQVLGKREVIHLSTVSSREDLVGRLSERLEAGERFDFVLLDLRLILPSRKEVSEFLVSTSDKLFQLLREILIDDRYCGVVVCTEDRPGGGFPTPWSVAQACRTHLRLRDEKVGICEPYNGVIYCVFMQAAGDLRPAITLGPHEIVCAQSYSTIPTWVIPKPPPRKKNEVLHPAKYPETLIEGFIEIFTKPGDTVLDPMVGTGSSVVASVRKGRNGVGIDLISDFCEIAKRRVESEIASLQSLFGGPHAEVKGLILQGDATHLSNIHDLPKHSYQYAVTSPPYWSMLANPGSENQAARRKKDLPLVYSNNVSDLGNVEDYDTFVSLLEKVYLQVAEQLVPNGVLTVIVKNVKRNHILYPLAWDLTARLCGKSGHYDYFGTTLWCQDDVGLKPFAVGIHWVSNILHQYCLHFRKRRQ